MNHFHAGNNSNSNNSSQNSGNQEANSLAAQWASLTPQQQQLLYLQQQNVGNSNINNQQRNQFQQQTTMEQYLIQQQWMHQQQLMASYGSQLYSAGNTISMTDNNPVSRDGGNARDRNYGTDNNPVSRDGGNARDRNYGTDNNPVSRDGGNTRDRNYGKDRYDRHHPYHGNRNDSKQGNRNDSKQGNRNDSKQGNYTQRDHYRIGISSRNSPHPPSESRPAPPHPPSGSRPAPPPPPPPPRSLTCGPCGQKFSGRIGYEAHLQAHKQCSLCSFSALSKPLAQHIAKEHSDSKKAENAIAKKKDNRHDDKAEEEADAAVKNIFQSNESPKEIAAWIETRKKRYPSAENLKLKEEEKKIKEELFKEEPKKVHNPTSFKVCKFYQKGKCKLMEDCPYQHSIPLNKPTASAAASAQEAKSAVTSGQSSPQQVKALPLTNEEQLLLDAIKYICKENMMELE